jgi:hypothetical protein
VGFGGVLGLCSDEFINYAAGHVRFTLYLKRFDGTACNCASNDRKQADGERWVRSKDRTQQDLQWQRKNKKAKNHRRRRDPDRCLHRSWSAHVQIGLRQLVRRTALAGGSTYPIVGVGPFARADDGCTRKAVNLAKRCSAYFLHLNAATARTIDAPRATNALSCLSSSAVHGRAKSVLIDQRSSRQR